MLGEASLQNGDAGTALNCINQLERELMEILILIYLMYHYKIS